MKPFVIFCFIVSSIFSYSQDMPSKTEKASFEVLGNCGMCKDRIEKAALNIKGVKYASWDIPSGQLRLVFNGLKTNLDVIEMQIAASGHDTENHETTVETYDQLPACCQYVRKGEEPKPGQMTKH
jgi:copper chaperone CopZ